ncbi:M17 family metallopeptidase [Spiroplasma eriocheiris]|uniref:Probable cytosol aminopeptidase n=1 Tax=Spiroplasma eriocheiris TaxID=315358 RepID=A0A0H3XLM3_9MOLU|nr:M17 family metallopeptidase [Spiroplasma eriocheiris]AHF58007.1 leucyl aminopeptidase [Spiroplasma eriocheiris CCTCC M 207170]AKM54449.1 leucyl aminopeptidase [Spiroplasma eriocheiris]
MLIIQATTSRENSDYLTIIFIIEKTSKQKIILQNITSENQSHIELVVSYDLLADLFHYKKKLINVLTQISNSQILFDFSSFSSTLPNCTELLKTSLKAILYVFNPQKCQFKKELPNVDYNLLIYHSAYPDLEDIIPTTQRLMQWVNTARYLQDMPANLMTPVLFTNFWKDKLKNMKNLIMKIYENQELTKMGLNLLLAVNQGSSHRACMIIVEYQGNKTTSEYQTAFVGKVITFDSGGYCLKSSSGQLGMKFDMSGAAIVLAAISALAEQEVPANILAVAMLTENAIGGNAILTESVVKSHAGWYVEINNTDAEGRLVLADGISYAKQTYQPATIIDVATLTGSVKNALGVNISGMFSNNEKLVKNFTKVTKNTLEPVWWLPIQLENYDNLTSEIADFKNAATNREYGVGNGAAFISKFAGETPWLHLDIAGTADYHSRGTGVMVESLVEFIKIKNF